MPRPRLTALLAFSFLGLSAVLACGGDDDFSPDGPPTADAATSADATATTGARVVQEVGAGGGTVKTESGSGVEIPAGALGANVDVSVEEDPTAPAPQAAGDAVGTPVTFGPEGQQFSVPVTVTLVVDTARLPAGKTLADVVVMTAPRDSTAFTALPTRVRDGSVVAADTMHFSTFVPFVLADAPDGGEPDASEELDAGSPDADAPDADALDAGAAPDAEAPDSGTGATYIGNIGLDDPRWPGHSPTPSGPGETVRLDAYNTSGSKVGSRVFFLDPDDSENITVYVAPLDGPGARQTFLQLPRLGRPSWMRLTPFLGDAHGNVYWIETDDASQTSALKRKRADDPASTEEILGATNPLYYGFSLFDEVVYYLDRFTSELRGIDLTTGTETTYGTGRPCNIGGGMAWVDEGKIYWRGEADLMVFDGTTHSTGIPWGPYDCGWHVRAGKFYAGRTVEPVNAPAHKDLVVRDLTLPDAPETVLFTSNAAIGQQLGEYRIEGDAAYGIARWNTEAPNRLARVSLIDGAFQPIVDVPVTMSLLWTTPTELWLGELYGYVPDTNPRFMSSRIARIPRP